MDPDSFATLDMPPGATMRDTGFANGVRGQGEQARNLASAGAAQGEAHVTVMRGAHMPVTPGTANPRRSIAFDTPEQVNNKTIQQADEAHERGCEQGGATQMATPETTEVKNAVEAAVMGLLVAKSEEEIKQDFKWQREKGVAGKGDIKDEILAYSPEIKSFGVVFKGSPAVKVLHGITKYHGRHAPELNGAVLGRIGKWTTFTFSTPQIVQLPPVKPFNWTRVKVPSNTAAFREFHAKPENKGKLYRAEDNEDTVVVNLPYLCHLPAPAALYAIKND